MRRIVRAHLEKAIEATIAAIESYNRPRRSFRTAQFLVLSCIGWTALFHAIFYQRGQKPWYRRNTRAVRYQYVDGDPKHWDLSECLRQYYGGNNPPERSNLELIAGLRNKVEHRHLPEADAGLYGYCQACLSNFEDALVTEFGQRFALADSLAVSLQFSRAIPHEKEKAVNKLAARSVRTVFEYVERFHAGLPTPTLESQRFCFSVFLVPKVANRPGQAELSIEFLRYDPNDPGDVALQRRLVTLIRERHVPVANIDLLRPKAVIAQLTGKLAVPVKPYIHVRAWQRYRVRPRRGFGVPEKTDPKYCVYDKANDCYLYTPAWVEFLTARLSDAAEYAELIRQKPQHTAS